MEKYMTVAINEAKKSFKKDEVPVGACIVKNDKIISRAHNVVRKKKNSLYHAEVIAIKKAVKKLKDFRLTDCTLFVTLEPCAMCSGYIINSRISKVVFGAKEPKFGCAGSLYNLLEEGKFNHTPEVVAGVLEKECADLMQKFFLTKRNKK